MNRGGSRGPARSNIEFFVTKANGWKPLTFNKKNFTQDLANKSPRSDSDNNKNGIYKLNGLFEKLILKQSRPKPKSIIQV